jgi:hypothetical protein
MVHAWLSGKTKLQSPLDSGRLGLSGSDWVRDASAMTQRNRIGPCSSSPDANHPSSPTTAFRQVRVPAEVVSSSRALSDGFFQPSTQSPCGGASLISPAGSVCMIGVVDP